MKSSTLTSLALIALIGCGDGYTDLKKKTSGEEQDRNQADSEENANPTYIAGSDNKPTQIVVIGDSIESGVLADTEMGNSDDFQTLIDKVKGNFAVLGSRAGLEQEVSKSDLSYATTSNDWGLRAKFGARNGIEQIEDVRSYTVAKWGRTTEKLSAAVTHVKNNVKQAQDVQLIVLGLGPNDFCDEDRTPEQLEQSYSSAIDELKSSYDRAEIVLLGIPRITSLRDSSYSYAINNKYLDAKRSCEDFRKHYCKPLFDQNADERLNNFNAAIDRIGQSNAITIVSQVKETTLDPEKLAVDCFHPNENGQKEIARAIDANLK